MINKNQKLPQNDRIRINEQIRCPLIMLVENNQNLGTYTPDAARRIAMDQGLDLVEVAPLSRPPVCRIMDYGKYKYELCIKEKEKKKKQKQNQEKEIWLSPSIGEHDILIKSNAAKKFLLEGHRVCVKLKYKRRENAHKELGFDVIQKFITLLAECGVPQSQPRLEGNFLNCIFEPKK